VADGVEFVGGDSGADEGCCVFEDFTGELRGSERGGAERESGLGVKRARRERARHEDK
jgi:hypothetical protein